YSPKENESAERAGFSRSSSSSEVLSTCDRVIFENEFIQFHEFDPEILHKARPRPELIQQLQDKIEQKSILRSLQIPTADFRVLNTENEVQNWIADAR